MHPPAAPSTLKGQVQGQSPSTAGGRTATSAAPLLAPVMREIDPLRRIQFAVSGVTITVRRTRHDWTASAARDGRAVTWGRGPENPSTGIARPLRAIGDREPLIAAILLADRIGLDQTAVSDAFVAATRPAPTATDALRTRIQRIIDADPDAGARLDDLVHDEAAALASGVNNDGLAAQLEFLARHGVDAARVLAEIHPTAATPG